MEKKGIWLLTYKILTIRIIGKDQLNYPNITIMLLVFRFLKGKVMNSLFLNIIMSKQLRKELILASVFSIILIIYCCNPYVINPTEFTLYTKYFVIPGFLIWLLVSLRLNIIIVKSIPFEWIRINHFDLKSWRILPQQLIGVFVFFLILISLLGLVIASVITITFSSGMDLYGLIFKLFYLNFAFPFIWAWLIGLSTSLINRFYSLKKTVLFISLILTWVITLFILDYMGVSSTFIDNRWSYIDPILSLPFIKDILIIKVMYFLCFAIVYFIFIKFKRAFLAFSTSLIFVIFITFSVYKIYDVSYLEELLLTNDFNLSEQFQNKLQDSVKMTQNWSITGVEVNTKSKYPIQIEITLNEKYDSVRFSINDQFTIAKIKNKDEILDFKQLNGTVQVHTNGAQSMVLYYEKTLGTSFYPFMDNVIFLPYEADWYPSLSSNKPYSIDSKGYIYTSNNKRKCKQMDLVVGKNNFSWQGDNLGCLSIIKGSYKPIEIPGTKLLIYQPFVTKKKNYKELQSKLLSIRNELCNSFEKLNNSDYCKYEVDTISVIPKSLNTSDYSLYDSNVSNGSYSFYVNPLLDVNYQPVTAHLEELSTFLIPYGLFEEERLSFFTSQYLAEKLSIQRLGYLDYVMKDYLNTPDSQEEWDRYLELPIEKKEKVLIEMAAELR